jgi:hypothetical protein
MVVHPTIRGADIGGEVIAIRRPVICVGAALGDHLDLAADRPREVGRLVERRDLELFDTFYRRWQNPRWAAARLRAACASKVRGVRRGIARHIVGVIPAIQHEHVLVGKRTRCVPARGCTGCNTANVETSRPRFGSSASASAVSVEPTAAFVVCSSAPMCADTSTVVEVDPTLSDALIISAVPTSTFCALILYTVKPCLVMVTA